MEQQFQDVEHYARVVAGIENMDMAYAGMEALNDDGRYAQTVLRRHVQYELGDFAGNESIGEKIKAGAGKLKEWIAKFIAGIKNMITAVDKKFNKEKYAKIERELKQKKLNEEHLAFIKKEYGSLVPRIEAIIEKIKKVDGIRSAALGRLGDMNILLSKLDVMKKNASEGNLGFSGTLSLAITMLKVNVPRMNDALASYAGKSDADKSELTKGTETVNTLSSTLKSLIDMISTDVPRIAARILGGKEKADAEDQHKADVEQAKKDREEKDGKKD